jgi:hypothetical protein
MSATTIVVTIEPGGEEGFLAEACVTEPESARGYADMSDQETPYGAARTALENVMVALGYDLDTP